MSSYDQSAFFGLVPPKKPRKIARVLLALCQGAALTRFDAERKLNDHTLNSTISSLVNIHKVSFDKKWVTVPGYMDELTACVLYSVDQDLHNLEHCLMLLKMWGYTPPEPPGVLMAA